jgi:hypothetical protein
MTLAEVLVVVFEVAAAVLVQATHVGGPIAVLVPERSCSPPWCSYSRGVAGVPSPSG